MLTHSAVSPSLAPPQTPPLIRSPLAWVVCLTPRGSVTASLSASVTRESPGKAPYLLFIQAAVDEDRW